MNSYYWLGPILLAPQSIVLPGNWYRLVKSINGHPSALLEEVFDRVRIESYPNLPSRKSSLFVFADKQNAIEFWQSRHLDILYKVEEEKINSKTAVLDMSFVQASNSQGNTASICELETLAVQYWESANMENCPTTETLIEGSIRIIEQVHAPLSGDTNNE